MRGQLREHAGPACSMGCMPLIDMRHVDRTGAAPADGWRHSINSRGPVPYYAAVLCSSFSPPEAVATSPAAACPAVFSASDAARQPCSDMRPVPSLQARAGVTPEVCHDARLAATCIERLCGDWQVSKTAV
jgi:hypothetical protein